MELLYPMRGRPLLRHGRGVFALGSGHQVGVVVASRVYGPAGGYVSTIDEDCLVYRAADAARRGAGFTPAVILIPETLDELADSAPR